MRTVKFRRLLDEHNALRVSFDLDKGEVIKFVVQFECYINDVWVPIVRYDTAHGFAHCDRLHPYQETLKTRLLTQNYNEALNFAMEDLTSNWLKYRERYQEWLQKQ